MFDVWRQLDVTAGAVFANALAKVHCVRHVGHDKTKDAMSYNPLWVGVVSFRKVTDIVEIEHVRNKKNSVVYISVANRAG